MDNQANPQATMIGLSIPTLLRLREATSRALGDSALAEFREAGYEGGASVFTAFLNWASGEGAESVVELALDEFGDLLERFFASAGWGSVRMRPLNELLAVVEIDGCWEAASVLPSAVPTCYITTGALTGFFEQIGVNPLAALEYRCQSCGDARCEFVVGSPASVQDAYERIARGTGIDQLVAVSV